MKGNTPIYINGRFLTQPKTGVQKFARAICQNLIDLGHEIVLLCPPKTDDALFNSYVRKIGSGHGQQWEQTSLQLWILQHKVPMLLNLCNSAPLALRKQIVTIHDMAFMEHPEWFSPAFAKWYRFLIPKIVKRSTSVITVSEFSKSKLLRWVKTTEDKIKVLSNGVYFETKTSENTLPFDHKTENYLLCLGNNNPRKNLQTLIKAFSAFARDDVKLVVVGKDQAVFPKREKTDHPNILWIEDISDEELVSLYKNAKGLVYPSFYEGFGIPILEALSFKCPVICSKLPVFEEIFGDIPIYFDPKNSDELTDIFKRIDTVGDHFSQHSNKVEATIKKYTYLDAANSLANIYYENLIL